MQALLSPCNVGLARHQNVLRPSQCSASSSGAVRRTAGIERSRRHQLVTQAALIDEPTSTQLGSSKRKWTYKYKHHPCPSPCKPGEQQCLELEALFQNVLSFPNLPAPICRAQPSLTADMNSMTALVEQMAAHFGKELTLCYIRKQPKLLNLDFNTVLERCNNVKDVVGVRDIDIPQMLRKCPGLLLLDGVELKQRYEHIPRLVQFNPLQVRQLVVKFPPIMTFHPQRLAGNVERLRQLCYTREEWARDFDSISPSLLAYFLRDATDQLMRLEYLASTGERPEWQLREVMKPANRSFRSKLRNFVQWEVRVKHRRAQQRAAAQLAEQQATQQAEAAAIKAMLLAAEDSDSGEQQQQQQQQRQQQDEGQQQQTTQE